MSDHLSKRAQVLAEILRYINDGQLRKKPGKAGHSASAAAHLASRNRGNANKDEVVFQKMRHLVYDHVARTVAIERTSLSSPPTVDSLADRVQETDG